MPLKTSSTQLNEEEIQFKKRANRRLLGAVALVLLMVALLPMVLDDRSSKAPQQEIAITIPSQDGSEFTSKIVPVNPETPITEAPAPQMPETKAAATENTESQTVTKPAEKSRPVEQVEPMVPSVPKAKESIVIPTNKEPKAASVKPEKNLEGSMIAGTGAFLVQIGVFSDAANVRQMQDKLKSLGYKSYTEKLETPNGEKIRLRAGPFASRPDAENALEKIKGTGLNGMVVTNK